MVTERVIEIPFQQLKRGNNRYNVVIRPGDRITGQSTVISIEEKAGRSGHLDIAVLETEYRNQRAELVVIARSTIVIKEGGQ